MSALPYWLLDVDGVVNCSPAPLFNQLMESQDWRDDFAGRFKVWWQAPVVDRINEIHAAGLAEIVWLTTWDQEAATLLAPKLGLRDFAVLEGLKGTTHQGPYWWKWKTVVDLAPTGPFVWTDDQLTRPMRDIVRAKFGDRGMLVQPDGNPGLTLLHLDRIERFLKAVQRG